jgi:flavin-dependent dehydrogenase
MKGTAMTYDLLIVGGRVAGASLALLLGRRGYRVLMVDRDQFPSDTLSTHYMHPVAVEALARLGVLADVEAAGFRRVTRARTYLEDCLFEGPIGPPPAYGLAPRRDVLDATIVKHATLSGVEFRDRTIAEGLIEHDGRVVGATLRTAGAASEAVQARVVVGADGKSSPVAKWVNAATYSEVPALRPAYYGYFLGVEPLPEPTIEIFYRPGQIGFIFPMQPGVHCLALEVQPDDFAGFRASPLQTFMSRFEALQGMATRLTDATLEGKLLGTRGVENYFRVPYGPGWALTGDAGYCRDPSTGTGIGDCLEQSFLLADALDAALSGSDWDASLAEFQRKRDAMLMPAFQGTLNYTRAPEVVPESVAWLRGLLSSPGFVRTVANTLPALLNSSDVLSPNVVKRLEGMANDFAVS